MIDNYYTNLQQGNLNTDEYYATNVSQYITKTNITSSEIKKIMETSKSEFTNQQCSINNNDISLNRTENEIRYYKFWLHYRCFRVSMHKTEECDVNVEIGINNLNKFSSYRETKIENLKFY